MKNKLPANWKITKVGNLCSQLRGISYQKGDAYSGEFENSVWVLRGGNIQDGKIVINKGDDVYVSKELVREEQLIRKGDVVIVSSTGSKALIGKAAHAMEDMPNTGFGAFLTLLRPIKEIDSLYFDYFFQTENYRESIRELSGGININNIRRDHIDQLDFPLAPPAEQEQISKKLDEIFGHLDLLNTRLDRIPELIKAFKEKVLTYAVTGKLTEEWRIKQTTKEWPKKSIDQVAELVSGYAFKSSDYTDDGYQLIRMGNLYQDKLDLTRNPVFIPRTTDKVLIEKYSARTGDILLSLTGTKYKRDYGYAVQIENIEKTLLVNQRILCLRPKINKEYLLYVLRTNVFRDQFFSFETGGVNQGNVGSSAFSKILIPIPPAEEQELIVTKIKELFSIIDKINLHYSDCQKLVENMPGNLLNKAFTGNLLKEKNHY